MDSFGKVSIPIGKPNAIVKNPLRGFFYLDNIPKDVELDLQNSENVCDRTIFVGENQFGWLAYNIDSLMSFWIY